MDKIATEFKLLIDIIREDRLSPLSIRSKVLLFERSFQEEFYSNLENLESDKRTFYIKKSISVFNNLRNRVEISNELIQHALQKEGLSIDNLISEESSKLRSLLYYDSKLHFNLKKIYSQQGYDVSNLRINFAKYFVFNTLVPLPNLRQWLS